MLALVSGTLVDRRWTAAAAALGLLLALFSFHGILWTVARLGGPIAGFSSIVVTVVVSVGKLLAVAGTLTAAYLLLELPVEGLVGGLLAGQALCVVLAGLQYLQTDRDKPSGSA